MRIVKIGHKALRGKCKKVSQTELRSRKFQTFLKSMIKTMRLAQGVGLAANQVAVSCRAVVLECRANQRYPHAEDFPLQIFINPRILRYSKEKIFDWEGCLSIPGYRGLVPRSKKVTFEALSPEGKRVVQTVEGFHARVIQHEVDHISGKFYIDRMPDLMSWTHLEEWQR